VSGGLGGGGRRSDDPEALIRTVDGSITFWSPGMARRYGFLSNEAQGRRSHDLLGTIFPRPREDIQAVLADRGNWSGLLIQRHSDGRLLLTASAWYLHTRNGGDGLVTEVHCDVVGTDAIPRRDAADLLGSLNHAMSESLTSMGSYLSGVRSMLRVEAPEMRRLRDGVDAASAQVARGAETLRLLRQLVVALRGSD
jgi:hypothetical protein